MKTFKEFIEDFKNDEFSMTYNDKLIAYAAYCQGYIEGIGHERRMDLSYQLATFPASDRTGKNTCNSETK